MADQTNPVVETDSRQPEQTRWLGVGLFTFGFVNGLTAGLSVTDGTAQTLLTSLTAFVGGSLLTFAGFMRPTKKEQDKPQIDPRRVGIGVTCFSLGILAGLLGGMELRRDADPQPEAESAEQAAPPAPSFGSLHITCEQGGPPRDVDTPALNATTPISELSDTPISEPDDSAPHEKRTPAPPKSTPRPNRGYQLHDNERRCEDIKRKMEEDWLGVRIATRRDDEAFWKEHCQ